MKILHWLTLSAILGGHALPASAAPLRVASWNLGWHIAEAEYPRWLGQCGKSYAKSAADGVWRAVAEGTPGATVGWMINESRAQVEGVDLSLMPPCGVYEGAGRTRFAPTAKALEQRNRHIAALLEQSVDADVIAFQEVSGTAAVREALGRRAKDYRICSFDGEYKVQRLAFAWKKELGAPVEACKVWADVALPHLSPQQQVRPAYTVALKIRGQIMRFMTVHLKSSCVSPWERGGRLDGDTGPSDPCPTLQQQVGPLEQVFEQLPLHQGLKADHFIMLGDFNRNLWHEANELEGAKAVRSDGSTDLSTPLAKGVKTQNLYKEINDGVPAASRAALVSLSCPVKPELARLCELSKTEALRRDTLAPLGAANALGCRNPIGLDHFIVSDSLKPRISGASKVAIGALGQTLAPNGGPASLAVSDHCPIVLSLDL
jgi:endonuclease/exonuclease/phosphatase family metal-dependent hydrolase